MSDEWADNQRRYWDDVSQDYDALYNTEWSRCENRVIESRLRHMHSTEGMIVLDLGCGTGLGYELLDGHQSEIRYIGRDISSRMLGVFTRKHEGVEVSIGQMDELSDLQSNRFDLVIALFAAASYSPSLDRLLAECYRVARPGGTIYLSFLNRCSLRRLLRLRLSGIERFSTRRDNHRRGAPVVTYTSRALQEAATRQGFSSPAIHGGGPLSGVLEVRQLWRINTLIAEITPALSHIIDLHARKPNPT